MPYTAPISRINPTCLLFLLDQSSSMLEPFGAQPEQSKAAGVADAINRLLQNLILKCARADGVRDFFYVGMASYGGRVQSAFGGPLAGENIVPISQLANNPLRVEVRTRKVMDGAGGLVDDKFKFPVWFEAHPTGRTPMCEVLREATEYVQRFLRIQPNCYPPIVINITDGHPTDGDPRDAAKALRGLASTDGNVLLFNAHLSDKLNRPIEFPSDESGLPDEYAKLLFQMSSELPPTLLEAAKTGGFAVGPRARGFVFNADLVAVIRFLDIGTRIAQKLRLPMALDEPLLRWRALGLPKHGHTRDEYEDASADDVAAGRFAVADGASESAFAGLWARLLVEGFVAAPRLPDLWGWLNGPRLRWSAEVMGLKLPWYGEMKRAESAYATLLGLDVRLPTADRPGLWRAVAVGDSCLVRVRKERHIRAFPLKRSADFSNAPELIGSWDKTPPQAEYTSGALLPGDRLFLMTDALAQWFLHQHEQGGRPWEALGSLLSGAQQERAVADWVEEQRTDNGLRDDDLTLLLIEVSSETKE